MFKGYGKKKLELMTKTQILALFEELDVYDMDILKMNKNDLIKEVLYIKQTENSNKKSIPKSIRNAV